jgi:hypothetical protein
MSTTLAAIRGRVLARLNALDGRKAVGRAYLDQVIRDEYLGLQARLPAIETYTANAGTISAGSESFTLPTASGAEYSGNFKIRLRSTNIYLTKLTGDEMALFKNSAQSGAGFSRSQFYQPIEGTDQSVVCWVWPLNAAAEPYDLWVSTVAADTTATDIAAWTLALGRYGQEALVAKVAAAVALSPAYLSLIDADLRSAVGAQAAKWDAEGARTEYQEAARRHRIESVGRIQRLVS